MPTARLTGRSAMISRREQQDTGFWDNILARGIDGRVQIAYGHHRWKALMRIKPPDFVIDIPVKDLDDATMLKVMANENMEEWRLGPKIIDETVRVTKKFLEEHPEEVKKYRKDASGGVSVGTPEIVGIDTISRFLGWNRTRVQNSLERLHLIDEGILDKEAVESMPSDNAARELFDGDCKRICVSMGMERKVEGSYTHRHVGLPKVSIPHIPVEPEIGVIIRIETPPGVGPGPLGIVRRSEIGDQDWGWTGH
jgi:hypothetical protein